MSQSPEQRILDDVIQSVNRLYAEMKLGPVEPSMWTYLTDCDVCRAEEAFQYMYDDRYGKILIGPKCIAKHKADQAAKAPKPEPVPEVDYVKMAFDVATVVVAVAVVVRFILKGRRV